MEKQFVVGVDVGGQTAKIGIVDARGDVLIQSVIRTDSHEDANIFVSNLADAIKDLIAKSGKEGQIRGVGVGAPNGNYYTGEIAFAPNLVWAAKKNVPFADMLSEALGGIPVALTNDANAAAVGEMTYGVAKGMKHFIMITLGTGVGSGIVINGEVLYGSDGFAGELGHTCAVRHNGRQCGCGKQGCLEAYCSAMGVARTAREWLEMSDEPSLLRSVDKITSKDVFDAAKEGDVLAKKIFDYTGRILGEKLADFIEFSAPEAIVLFGGLARAKEYIYEPTLKAMNENVLPLWRDKVDLLFSQLKESDAAILGASALAWEL
ncbi:MAG: ROK family protein [Bacteroidales bacterium]|jgi:glucokinase|nr:ROK family protein [Bacteroidales bacterium]MDD7608090.1 ROK family protein [Bacteroidales bacterium]MDY5459692.1 ROK family protein [Candidatus Cryptobacteroides sp.]MEE0340841.1 ROK family protein [Bacteroidales bacterium]